MPAPKIKSKDPQQQKLRDQKQKFNNGYKMFSQKLKAFKDGINGRGNAKVGIPPSNIRDPLPNEVSGILNQLTSDFNAFVGAAEKIIAEQARYSQNRKKKQPKQPAIQQMPTEAPEAGNVVETLSRLGSPEYDLEKEASNKLSRFWQYLTAIFSSKKYNKQRVGLLSQASDLYYSILDLENDALSLNINSVPNTIAKYRKFKYNFDSFIGTFRGVESLIERDAEKQGVVAPKEGPAIEQQEPAPQPKPEKEFETEQSASQEGFSLPGIPPELLKIRYDIHLIANSGLEKQPVIKMHTMFREYKNETDPHIKSLMADRIKENYREIVKRLLSEVQKRYGQVNPKSVQEILELLMKDRKLIRMPDDDETIKTSHNAFSRYLKRKLVKSVPSNRTAPVRLEIVEALDEMKQTVKNIMDNLEKGLSLEDLRKFMEQLEEVKDRLKRPLHVLNVFYMKEFFMKKEKKQQKGEVKPEMTGDEELMDYVLKRKLKRQLSEDIL